MNVVKYVLVFVILIAFIVNLVNNLIVWTVEGKATPR